MWRREMLNWSILGLLVVLLYFVNDNVQQTVDRVLARIHARIGHRLQEWDGFFASESVPARSDIEIAVDALELPPIATREPIGQVTPLGCERVWRGPQRALGTPHREPLVFGQRPPLPSPTQTTNHAQKPIFRQR